MTTYYIDPANGDNGNEGTSLETAFADFHPVSFDGKASLEPGDTVKCRGQDAVGSAITGKFDSYRLGDVNGDPIVIEPYQDENPVVDGADMDDSIPFHLNRGQNFVIRGLEIKNGSDRGLQIRSTSADQPAVGNLIENCHSHHNGGSGFIVSEHAHNNRFVDCLAEEQQDPGSGDGFQAAGGTSPTDNEFIDCVARNNADDGFDMWDGEHSYLLRCEATGNGETSNGQTGDGNGYKLGNDFDSSSGGHRLERCLAWKNTERGFNTNASSIPNEIVNCTAWNTGTGFRTVDNADNVFRNNIAADNSSDTSFGVESDDTSNTWNLGIEDPSFASTDPSTSEFLRLSADSPCIDAGEDVEMDYNGEAPDLGAFEYQATSSTDAQLKFYDGSIWQTVDTVVKYKST